MIGRSSDTLVLGEQSRDVKIVERRVEPLGAKLGY
jgi:hypothetical protein